MQFKIYKYLYFSYSININSINIFLTKNSGLLHATAKKNIQNFQ